MSFVPCSSSSVNQASTAPGTVAACALSTGISLKPRSTYHSTVAFIGARPEPLSASGLPAALGE